MFVLVKKRQENYQSHDPGHYTECTRFMQATVTITITVTVPDIVALTDQFISVSDIYLVDFAWDSMHT